MKYLLVALVVIIAIGIWRNNRRKAGAVPPPKPRLRQPEDMVTCAHCGLHLPSSDAITSPDRTYYCSTEHRHLGPR
ncbi:MULTISPECIES: PP0621 family protein [Comamonas]|jgi:uncharacterized protein|uniref:PP0621 family protein n=1 Tax=Comamonas TaxID=283 RepID=UPI0017856FA1|nr:MULTISPECIES: PP0621 family protein [Comamonas]MBD9400733.1 hypothetical protein [Comamonas sp. CMM02]